MATRFRDAILRIAPPWLRKPNGARFLFNLGLHVDAVAEQARLGVRARMPGFTSIAGALPARGSDVSISRGWMESEDSYVARLQRAWDDWGLAGSPVAVAQQLLGYLSPTIPLIRIVTNGFQADGTWITDWITLAGSSVSYHRASPSNWNWDGSTDRPARFWVIAYCIPSVWQSIVWGPGRAWGTAGQSWGSTADVAQIGDMKRIISQWKAAGSAGAWMLLSGDDALFDPTAAPGAASMPDGTWGNWSRNVAGVQVPSRAGNVLYCDL